MMKIRFKVVAVVVAAISPKLLPSWPATSAFALN